jgi:glycosyltransferase involved in cell wall biosynthesis
MKKGLVGILILTPFFSPNIGGVETHFDDLVTELDRRGYRTFVQTYSPITTENVSWRLYERRGNNIHIRRYRWFGKKLFHKVEKFPILDFLYLTPYLFVRTFIWMLFSNKAIDIIHAQGFNAAWIGGVLKKIFKKKLIVSTHAIYEINNNSSTARRIVSVLNKADKVLCLSRGAYNELLSWGFDKNKLDVFKYWVDLEIFKSSNKHKINTTAFTVLFVGRLLEKKGVRVLAKVAEKLPHINFIFIGTGPDAEFLRYKECELKNIKFIGMVPNKELCKHYNNADIFCIPSQYEEGFGRVTMEALACGLPVVGSNKGGIREAVTDDVSILVEPTVNNLMLAIKKLYTNKEIYNRLQKNTAGYAKKNFSKENIELIIKHYNL